MALSTRLQKVLDTIVNDFGDGSGMISMSADELVSHLTTKNTTKSSKSTRNPDEPKRPKSAFMHWASVRRSQVRDAMILAADADTKIRQADVSKRLGTMWKDLSNEEKAPFQTTAAQEKQEYEAKMAVYRKEHGIEAPVKSTRFNPTEQPPVAPEGWAGPFSGFLEGSPKDAETGKSITKGFQNFDEAVAEAIKLGAGGITRTRVGYRIRMGREVSITEKSRLKGEVSWIIN